MRVSQYLLSKVSDLSKQFANFPDSYVKRSMEQVYYRSPKEYLRKPRRIKDVVPQVVERKKFRFTMNRPWTASFRHQNQPGSIRKKVFVEPIAEWSFFRGDRVEVLVGKDKGKHGIITELIPERNWVIVEGLNWHYRKVGEDKEYPGIIIKSESPLMVDRHVTLVDPSDLQSTKVEWRYTEEGEKVRVSLRTGRIIPIPKINESTHDYKTKGTYIEREKDTKNDVLTEITFEPKLCTFEMDIMESMGIKEDRVPRKSYWY